MNRLQTYIDDVISGRQPVGKLAHLAVERHLKDLDNKGLPYRFDTGEAAKAVQFAEICRHWKGEKSGDRIKLEPFQVFRRSMLFGWRTQEGHRRFTTSYYEVGRKNAKTTEAAIDALYHILFEEKNGAQVLCGATKEGQARIVVNDIGRIAQRTPELTKNFEYFYFEQQIKRVVHLQRASYIAPLSRDSNTSDGFDPSMGIIDEYHAHPTDKVLNIIESGMASRVSPLMNIITTAGFDRESPCYRLRKTAVDILEGRSANDRFLSVIYCMDEDDDWTDPQVWVKSNPNLGSSVNLTFLKDRYKKAQIEAGEKEVDFITKNLNRWMDAPSVWIPDAKWQAGKSDMEIPAGAECYGGLDLAKYLDINAFALYFPDYNYLKVYMWIPEGKLVDQREADYRRWVKAGWLRTVPGDVVDHAVVYTQIKEIVSGYNLQSLAFDRFLAYHTTITQLDDAGITMLEHGQGFRDMHTPTLALEEMVGKGELRHDGNPAMRWMVSNVVIDRDAAGNIKPTKGKSSGKIDGVVAAIMAIGASIKTEKKVGSIYNNWQDEFDDDE